MKKDITASPIIEKKIELSISIGQQTIDRQIQVHGSTKNSISILVAIIAILVSAIPKEVWAWLGLLFQISSVIIIVYAIWFILTIRLEVGPNMNHYLEKKKWLSYRNFLQGIHELISDAIWKNNLALEKLKNSYLLFRIFTIILIIIFIYLFTINYVR